MVRRGWLEGKRGPDQRRGRDEFVPLSWDAALDLLGAELIRVRDRHGAGSVFGGSYGWSSAGRFHHAQSQVHRFLNSRHGRLCQVGQYLQFRRFLSAAASHHRRLRAVDEA
jgi:biotin/methionine sulfoxide reductase